MYYSTKYDSPLGVLTIAADGKSLVGLWIEGQKYFGGAISDKFEGEDELPVLQSAKEWLNRYFAGERPDISNFRCILKAEHSGRRCGKFSVRSPMDR